jgi:hypothetical protein
MLENEIWNNASLIQCVRKTTDVIRSQSQNARSEEERKEENGVAGPSYSEYRASTSLVKLFDLLLFFRPNALTQLLLDPCTTPFLIPIL